MATIVRGKNANKPYTVRYYHDGKQREKSFATRKEANDFRIKAEHDIREQTFIDPKVAGEAFGKVAQRWLASHPGQPRTLAIYESALRMHVLPVFGSTPLAAVAADRESAETFLRYVLPGKGLGSSTVRTCYVVMVAIVRDAQKAGRLGPNANRLSGIAMPEIRQRTEIVFASHEQIEKMGRAMPDDYRCTIYLMRGCGLRAGEALGIQRSDITNGRLRLRRQLSPNGKSFIPLKHRREGDYRDIPVPGYVTAARARLCDVPPVSYRSYRTMFNRARDVAGLPKTFTPHALRHTFASVALAGGIPITDVSKWLGHRDINTTYSIYGHLVPESWDRARAVLDQEWGNDG